MRGSVEKTRMRSRNAVSILLCLMVAASGHPRSTAEGPDSSAAWREALPDYQFSFPRDHAAHPDNRIEWWYYTGNLETRAGRRFGYQLTFFRIGVVSEPGNVSRWALRDLYMSHFAISDINRQSFHSFERMNRAGIGWAGAGVSNRNAQEKEPSGQSAVRVWNEDWEVIIESGEHELRASEDGFLLDLALKPSKTEVVHGEKGVSQKGSTTGASHYYSLTRLESSGKIVVDGEEFEVEGLSWMDHEFGTSFLDDQQVGWDWFSIQLEDGRDLMLFQIRGGDGSIDPRSSGTLVEADGRAIHLDDEDFSLTPGRVWRSSESGASYPTTWEVVLAGYGLRLRVTAAFEDQELLTPESTGVAYWEGSVGIEGYSLSRKIQGRGYLEMTGYAGVSMGAMLR
ncbi:MAG TPA: lipocalin-like domain-containing protein [Blastocatellia bacterium]|nr:lipocalin-like domain-containing protein [Blastocatellia bacterium]